LEKPELETIFPLGFSGAEEGERLGVKVSATQVRSNGAQLAQVARLLDDGTIRVAIDSKPRSPTPARHTSGPPKGISRARSHSRSSKAALGRDRREADVTLAF
jgi:hypothetical protein